MSSASLVSSALPTRSRSSISASFTASIASFTRSLSQIVHAEGEVVTRHDRYRAAGRQKRLDAIGPRDHGAYYASLLTKSQSRKDPAAAGDLKQIDKDLQRTFAGLELPEGADAAKLLPMLRRVLLAYVERGRTLSPEWMTLGMPTNDGGIKGVVTTARGILTSYNQGLNFLAGMSMLAAGAGRLDARVAKSLEETAFWLLALLLEDVLDPDFFGADVKGNLQMAYIGGLGMRGVIVDRAQAHCPLLFEALGRDAFSSTVSSILDSWVLSLFVGCAPFRLLEELWDQLLIPAATPERVADGLRVPRGMALVCSFTLASLKCCGDDRLGGGPELARLTVLRQSGASPEDLSLEAGEVLMSIRKALLQWPLAHDAHLWDTTSAIFGGLSMNATWLWEEVRLQKQRVADCAGDYDEQLMALGRRTRFSVEQIGALHKEFQMLPGPGFNADETRCDLKTFKDVVRRVAPDFPLDLCDRLFGKLDEFSVGHLTFVELVCGMSALSLGTMEEKLQVCFDLFDSEGRRALSLKDLTDLCATLFRVALAQGFQGAKRASTTEDLEFSRLHGHGELLEQQLSGQTWHDHGTENIRMAGSPPLLYKKPSAEQSARQHFSSLKSLPVRLTASVQSNQDGATAGQPWRSMLLRLLAAAQVRTADGPRLVAFEDFRRAAGMEPAMLALFRWCEERPPDMSGSVSLMPSGSHSSTYLLEESCCRRTLRRLCCFKSRRLLPGEA